MATAAVALVLVPLACALVGFGLPGPSRVGAAVVGVVGAGTALALAVVLALRVRVGEVVETSRRVADFGDLSVTFGVRVDPAAAAVAVAVGLVALAVQVYSVAYLHPGSDDRYGPYAAQVSLFTAAMLVVVVSGDLVAVVLGWEVMGICSYLLIGHDRRLPEAPAAAVKAFLVTRVGDVGFLLGVAVVGVQAGSFRIADILAPGVLDAGTTTVACLLLLAGVAGKCAQFPLHTWLPDAMAGPTPVSALIHAATMVAAGVYLVTRLYPLFVAAPLSLSVLAVIAAVTMLLGALVAFAQDDVKRVLAWSTVSQVAAMTGALAVGSPAAALFHLLAHAATKALLFLAAGSVVHAVGSNLMSAMGGLRHRMPVTFWCMTIGLGSLVGLPPLAGFWSKEEILHVALDGTGWRHVVVYGAGLATVAVTAGYAGRLWLRVFFGEARSAEADRAHEPPLAMAVPVLVLAVPTGVLGFAALWPGFAATLGAPAGFTMGLDVMVTVVWALLGLAGVWWVWRSGVDPARVLGVAQPLVADGFALDRVQRALVVRPVTGLARAVRWVDESGVDGVVVAVGRLAMGAGTVIAAVHRGALPRAVTAVLGGAALLSLAAVVIAWSLS